MKYLINKLAQFKQWILSIVMPRSYETNLKRVIIYFKSGNKMRLKCKTFDFVIDKETNNRQLKMTDVNKYEWMIDLAEVEGYTVNKCFF